jgi:hypothetical protein
MFTKFNCFITGFNYQLITSCSEEAKKMTKRYAGLLILISLVWFAIGFSFATRYLNLGLFGGVFMASICVVAIILIERNIILSTKKKNSGLVIFRVILALVMAIIGSLIIDQIIFAEDVDERRIIVIQNKVNASFPIKSKELKEQIFQLNSQMKQFESRRDKLANDVSKNPTIKSFSSSSNVSSQGDSVTTRTLSVSSNDIPNPKIEQLTNVQQQLTTSFSLLKSKNNELLQLRDDLQKEFEKRRGFLDELKILYDVVIESNLSIIVYLMWFVFFLAIEMFIVFSKIGESENDYHRLIQQQVDLHLRRLEKL